MDVIILHQYRIPLYKDPLLKGSGCNLICLEARMKARAAKVVASRAAIAANGIAHLTAQAPGLYLQIQIQKQIGLIHFLFKIIKRK